MDKVAALQEERANEQSAQVRELQTHWQRHEAADAKIAALQVELTTAQECSRVQQTKLDNVEAGKNSLELELAAVACRVHASAVVARTIVARSESRDLVAALDGLAAATNDNTAMRRTAEAGELAEARKQNEIHQHESADCKPDAYVLLQGLETWLHSVQEAMASKAQECKVRHLTRRAKHTFCKCRDIIHCVCLSNM